MTGARGEDGEDSNGGAGKISTGNIDMSMSIQKLDYFQGIPVVGAAPGTTSTAATVALTDQTGKTEIMATLDSGQAWMLQISPFSTSLSARGKEAWRLGTLEAEEEVCWSTPKVLRGRIKPRGRGTVAEDMAILLPLTLAWSSSTLHPRSKSRKEVLVRYPEPAGT